jgi:acyl dehydratase/NAD(P)-dependent dehydrogenase (short-subunit alcohol dehydrogenase family)
MTSPSRNFDDEDQRWFASVSGDVNPIHVDAKWAAAHFPGAPVVHGQHILLWALDELVRARPGTHFASIQATYVKPVIVGDRVEASLSQDHKLVQIKVLGEVAAAVRVETGGNAALGESRFEGGAVAAAARPRRVTELAGLSGTVTLPSLARSLTTRFDALTQALGGDRVIGLAAISTLVGMECPGLHSMLSKIAVRTDAAMDRDGLAFQVRKFHESMSLVEIDVDGMGISGTVSAFTAREPAPAAPDEALRAMVSQTAFRGQRPLVVGATSGLGYATARLLAAGGADPVLTWHASPPDEIIRTVRTFGASGTAVRLDATAPTQGLADIEASGWDGEELYYFATPRIFRRRIEPYQKADFRDFVSVFVDGFHEIVRHVASRSAGRLTVFYPSSIAVQDSTADLPEYAQAKTMGEQLCVQMEKKMPHLKIVVARLPRIATRQTDTFLKVKSETSEAIMLPLIRTVQSHGSA